jgi:uncharacterized protein (TIGR00255 family)
MTGFGQAETKSPHSHLRAEIKTVNHKYLEVSVRLPMALVEHEESVRKLIGQEIRRGKISLFVTATEPIETSSGLVLNEELAKEVLAKVRQLEKVLKLKPQEDEVVLREILRYPEVITKASSQHEASAVAKDLLRTVNGALADLKKSRIAEGKNLAKDFVKRVGEIKKSLAIIEKRIPALAAEYGKNLEARVKEFMKEGDIDHERLTLETALYVKNSDISEEVTRMKSHLDAMTKVVGEDGEAGRKLDFIAQEMVREANTMGAKSSDVTIAGQVIQIKATIEKIREQAQNVE